MGGRKRKCCAPSSCTTSADKQCADIGGEDILSFARDLRTRIETADRRENSHISDRCSRLRAPPGAIRSIHSDGSDAIKVARRHWYDVEVAGARAASTLEELDRLMAHFEDVRARRPSSVPMARIVAFAIFSTRRMEEITRIAWPISTRSISASWSAT